MSTPSALPLYRLGGGIGAERSGAASGTALNRTGADFQSNGIGGNGTEPGSQVSTRVRGLPYLSSAALRWYLHSRSPSALSPDLIL